MNDFERVCVVGLGYIGLPTASLLATKGFRVLGIDINPEVVDTINAGDIHIREPELDVLVRSAVQSGQLSAATVPAAADAFIIAVPTPFKDGYVPDLQHVEDATRSVAPYLRRGNLLILESTIPVGTTARIAKLIAEVRPDLGLDGVHIAHCPERVLPGHILRELVVNDRIVGGADDASTDAAAKFYRSFVSGNVLTTTARTAELVKLVENTYRDVNIAFANELSLICDELDMDVWELIDLANHHPRVDILMPGPGVGGHCLAVDPWFIVDSVPTVARLIRTAREVNESKPRHIVERILVRARRIKEPVIGCFGLAYKADIDDLRESPALKIVESLAAEGVGRVVVVEPYVSRLPDSLVQQNVSLVDQSTALEVSDIIVGLVDHQPFKEIRAADLAEKIVIDARGIWR